MGEPEPLEPQSGSFPAPPPREDRADWLCGPEEGIEAELGRKAREAEGSAPAPRLVRPGATQGGEPDADDAQPSRSGSLPAPKLTRPEPPEHLRLVPPPAASEPSAAAPTPGLMGWSPGANSVPVPRRDSAAPPLSLVPPTQALAVPASPMDFPMDDAEERHRAVEVKAAARATAAERVAREHTVVTADSFDTSHVSAPWWMQVPVLLRENRKMQVLAGLGALLLLVIAFWPKPEKSLSLAAIRRDPTHFDGKSVRVAGRIGEVFEMGGGYAFYLHQGRDTLVVFTRSRTPRRGDRVTVAGSMSTGYFNGQSGTALFESVASH